MDADDDENRPQPHKRPQRPTVTSPGWILQSLSVGWNLWNDDESASAMTDLAELEGCDGRGGAG